MLKRVFNVGKISLVGVVLNFLLIHGVCAMEDVESGNCINTSSETINKENEFVVAKYLDGDNMLYSNNNAAVGKFVKVDSGQYNVWLNFFKNKLLREYNNLISDSDCAEMVNKFGLKPIKNINEVRDVYKDSLNAAREWLEYELISKFLSKGLDVAAVCSKVCEFWISYIPCYKNNVGLNGYTFDGYNKLLLAGESILNFDINGYKKGVSCTNNNFYRHVLGGKCPFCKLMQFYKDLDDNFEKSLREYRGYDGSFDFSKYFASPLWSHMCLLTRGAQMFVERYKFLYENGYENYSEQYIKKLYTDNSGKIKTNIEPSLRDYYDKTKRDRYDEIKRDYYDKIKGKSSPSVQFVCDNFAKLVHDKIKGKFPFFVQFVNMFVLGFMCSALVSIKEMENDLFNNSFAGSLKYLDGYGCVNLRNNAGKVIEDSFNMDKFVSCFDKRVEERLKLTFKNIGDALRLADRGSYDMIRNSSIAKLPLYDVIFKFSKDRDEEIISKLFDFFKSYIGSKFKRMAYLISLGNIFNEEDFVLSAKSFLSANDYFKILKEREDFKSFLIKNK